MISHQMDAMQPGHRHILTPIPLQADLPASFEIELYYMHDASGHVDQSDLRRPPMPGVGKDLCQIGARL